jgi:PPOX class probable F420-dependent enzyme
VPELKIRGAMDKAALDAFLRAPHLARIATIRNDWPHVVPMWFDWDGEQLWMDTGAGFQKQKNLDANPHCAVTIDINEGGLRFKGAILAGSAELITAPADLARQIAVRIYRKYLGDEGLAAPTPKAMVDGEHVIIRLRPDRIQTWDDTKTAIAPLP